MTLEKNTEYVITGLSTAIGSPALYRKGALLVRIGQGGDSAKVGGNGGGNGGGIGENTGYLFLFIIFAYPD